MTTHLEANSISAPAIFQSIENGDIVQIAQSYVQQSSTEVFCIIAVTLSTGYSIGQCVLQTEVHSYALAN